MTFKTYLENLCITHEEIQHTENERHFVSPNDNQESSIYENLRYPALVYSNESFAYPYEIGTARKSRVVTFALVHHIADTGSASEKEEKMQQLEDIIDDFILKMLMDKQNGVDCVLGFNPNNINIDSIYHQENALWGWLVQIQLSTTRKIRQNKFKLIND